MPKPFWCIWYGTDYSPVLALSSLLGSVWKFESIGSGENQDLDSWALFNPPAAWLLDDYWELYVVTLSLSNIYIEIVGINTYTYDYMRTYSQR